MHILEVFVTSCVHIHHHHHHHICVMELGHSLTRSGLTYPEVSSKVCHEPIPCHTCFFFSTDGALVQCIKYIRAATILYSVEIPTRCSFVIEFIIPKFFKGLTCFEQHTAHHQEL